MNNEPTQAPAPQQSPTSVQTPVQYSVGLLAKPKEAVISYDGQGTVTLTDSATNTVVFSQSIQSISRVIRAEYALYIKIPNSKMITVMFGNAKNYVAENAGMMPFGVPGAIGGVVRSNQMNKQSGLEQWVELFKANGKMKRSNLSPNSVVVFAAIGAVVIIIIAALISLL